MAPRRAHTHTNTSVRWSLSPHVPTRPTLISVSPRPSEHYHTFGELELSSSHDEGLVSVDLPSQSHNSTHTHIAKLSRMPHIVSQARRVGTVGPRSPVIPLEGREGRDKESKRVPRAVCAASVRVAYAVTKARGAGPQWPWCIRETRSPGWQPSANGWRFRASTCAERVLAARAERRESGAGDSPRVRAVP